MNPWILAENGRPFRDAQAADIRCALLHAEPGPSIVLEVRDHPEGGYGICCESPLGMNSPEGSVPLTTGSVPAVQRGAAPPLIQSAPPLPVRLSPELSQGADARPESPIDKTRLGHPDDSRLSPAARALVSLLLVLIAACWVGPVQAGSFSFNRMTVSPAQINPGKSVTMSTNLVPGQDVANAIIVFEALQGRAY